MRCASADCEVIKARAPTTAITKFKVQVNILRLGFTHIASSLRPMTRFRTPPSHGEFEGCVDGESFRTNKMVRHCRAHTYHQVEILAGVEGMSLGTSYISIFDGKSFMLRYEKKGTYHLLVSLIGTELRTIDPPSNPVPMGKNSFRKTLICRRTWSRFPREGCRSDNEGS